MSYKKVLYGIGGEVMENEKKKFIFDFDCILCKHFFECNGKDKKGQLCIQYEERVKKDGRAQNVRKDNYRQ